MSRTALLFILFTILAVKASANTVLLAILARNKAHVLERYLACIDALDYDKAKITVYINTNNNEDDTLKMLQEWREKNLASYRGIILDAHEVSRLNTTSPHDWTAPRFKVLGAIRNKSLHKTKQFGCDYYFVVDCDNFIAPFTLKELIKKDKPIIAPLLRPIPEKRDFYSNYHSLVTPSGYILECPEYYDILYRNVVGTFKAQVVHCTYLIKSEYIDKLTYIDGSDFHEYVVFSNSARNNNVDQYICNELEFGTLVHFNDQLTRHEEKRRLDAFFNASHAHQTQ